VGIGGIGMSALARYFNAAGKRVGGYDRVPTPLTAALEAEGIEISFTDNTEAIPDWFLETPVQNALVVYTPAIPGTHMGLAYLRNHGCEVMKRSEVLSAITEGQKTIAIAGTHGKTTTTAMVAHLLKNGGVGCNAFLGGISTNYNTNLLLDPNSNLAVVEADEFDRSFLRLNPDIAVITSTDADHLDIYGDSGSMLEGFQAFAGKVNTSGLTIIRHGLNIKPTGASLTYAVDDERADIFARNIRIEDGAYLFDVVAKGEMQGSARMVFPGRHNVENALAALAIMLHMKMPWDKISDGLATFRGVKRRFEYHIRRDDRVYIDDYAHHPSEISACVGSVKELYPDRRITGVFQPHLFSRTRDFGDDFARSLESLNELLLMEIYPAREEPIPGIDGEWLLNKVQMVNKKLVDRQELVAEVLRLQPEVLLTMGAGDIDKMIEPLKNALDEEDA
jgi:UDP-N-acetylmuramate--alanine ligase